MSQKSKIIGGTLDESLKETLEETAEEKEVEPIIIRRFRKDPKSLIIFFPTQLATLDGCITDFVWIGQHGAANYRHCVTITDPVDYEDEEVKEFLARYCQLYDCELSDYKLYKRNFFRPTL